MSNNRNQSCPCGSGRKHKKCCLKTSKDCYILSVGNKDGDMDQAEFEQWHNEGHCFPVVHPGTSVVMKFQSIQAAGNHWRQHHRSAPKLIIRVPPGKMHELREMEDNAQRCDF